MRRIAILCLGAVACAAAAAGQASAQVQPAGTGEPLYTNSAQNTQWFEWPASQGADAYRIRYDYYENNVLKASPVVASGIGSGTITMSNGAGRSCSATPFGAVTVAIPVESRPVTE